MKVLIAPNSLKDAANSIELADAIEEGMAKARPKAEIRKMPLADGGEYTLEILLAALGGQTHEVNTFDPLGRPLSAVYGSTNNDIAIIELPKASGYELLKNNERNPLLASTFGTGIQIKDALNRGYKKFLITLGGSATVDGGAGILQALGIQLFDNTGKALPHGGGNLIILDSFDTTEMVDGASDATFTLLCDVDNPLLGENGAAMVFAPQKGAGQMETMVLERCLFRYGHKCEEFSGKQLITFEGAGAAGGVPVGLSAFFKTNIISGTEYVLEVLNAEEHIRWADVIITAEGTLDDQTFGGKAPAVLAKKAKSENKKIICLAGNTPHRIDNPDMLFDAVFSIQNRPMSLKESIENTLENIKNTAFEIGRLL